MKGLTGKLEGLFSAITFAEAGEFETARQIVKESIGEVKEEPARTERDLQISVSPAKS